MNEARNFLRYLLPGLVFVINVFVPLTIIRWNEIKPYLDKISSLTGLVTLIGLLIASGGLGYVFSTIYFALRHLPRLNCHLEWNHISAIKTMNSKLGFSFELTEPTSNGTDIYDTNNSLIIANHYWYVLKGNKNYKHIDAYVTKLCDICHGLGATLVSSVLALIVLVLAVHTILDCRTIDIYMVFLFLYVALIPFIFGINYIGIKRHIERQINSSLLTCAQCGLFNDNKKMLLSN
jgi:hypothetical protein